MGRMAASASIDSRSVVVKRRQGSTSRVACDLRQVPTISRPTKTAPGHTGTSTTPIDSCHRGPATHDRHPKAGSRCRRWGAAAPNLSARPRTSSDPHRCQAPRRRPPGCVPLPRIARPSQTRTHPSTWTSPPTRRNLQRCHIQRHADSASTGRSGHQPGLRQGAAPHGWWGDEHRPTANGFRQ